MYICLIRSQFVKSKTEITKCVDWCLIKCDILVISDLYRKSEIIREVSLDDDGCRCIYGVTVVVTRLFMSDTIFTKIVR